MKLKLEFTSGADPELIRVAFERPGAAVRRSRRGKGDVIGDYDGTFQWTAAVKAFALLAVGSRLAVETSSSFCLSGEAGSAAASLDYAISKPTQWILDLFGADGNSPFARRVFRRENSERKLPGPVKLWLAAALGSSANLLIEIEGEVLESQERLQSLFAALGGELEHGFGSRQSSGSAKLDQANNNLAKLVGRLSESQLRTHLEELMTSSSAIGAEHSPSYRQFQQEWFFQYALTDTKQALREVELLESAALQSAQERLNTLSELAETELEDIFNQLTAGIPKASAKYQVLSTDEIKTLRALPLQVNILPLGTAACMPLRYLQLKYQLDLQFCWQYQGTSDIEPESIQSDSRTQAAVLSWGAALKRATSEAEALPVAVSMLPRTGFCLAAAEGSDPTVDPGQIYLSMSPLGYPRQVLDEMIAADLIPEPGSDSLQEKSLAEISALIEMREGLAIVPNLLAAVLVEKAGAQQFFAQEKSLRLGDNILFIEDLSPEQSVLWAKAIRSSWFELLEDPDQCHAVLWSILLEQDFIKFMQRIAGFHIFST